MKRLNQPSTSDQVQPLWEKLVRLEGRLRRNKKLSRIVQPVGIFVFTLNLLLTTGNFALFFENLLGIEFRLPVLSSLAEGLPRGSWTGLLAFSFLFLFVIPLGICGAITGIYYLTHRKEEEPEKLYGDEVSCAKALTNEAERVYALRKSTKTCSTYLMTGILTAVAALPILISGWNLMKGDSPAVLELALTFLALLLCLFVLFWIYALLFRVFMLLLSLLFIGPSQWKLYELYQRADLYWESVEPGEQLRREQRER